MPVAAQQQYLRGPVVPAGVFGNPVERFLQQREPFVARQTHMHDLPVGLARRTDRLVDLCRIAQHEVGGDRCDALGAPECGLEVDAPEVAETVPEFTHDSDVQPSEPVDRLPVVPDRKQLRTRRTVEQCFQQPHPGRGDVLELVDQDVAKRAAVTPGLHKIGRPVDHVVEVDLPGAGQRFTVALGDQPEHRQERLGPPPVTEGAGPFGDDIPEEHPATLEVLQEGRQEPRERIDPPLLLEDGEHPVARDGGQGHAMGRQLLRQVADQLAICPFVAEGLDQGGAALGMELPLPLHVPEILFPVDELRGPTLRIEPEMLDVDAVVREMEVGLVLALLRRRGVVLVERFVLVGDAVEIEEVRDLAFLVAPDLLALQRADVVPADVAPIRPPGVKLVLTPVRHELVREPFEQRP